MAQSISSAVDSRHHHSTRSQSLPQYLFRRGSTFYFKRKVPNVVAKSSARAAGPGPPIATLAGMEHVSDVDRLSEFDEFDEFG